jgi:hypothetical protein
MIPDSLRLFAAPPAPRPVLCIHCERRPAHHLLDLCSLCHANRGIRVLYLRRRGWTPQWEAHLRRLTARAQQGLPLFPTEGPRY